jgi:outer membrane protein
MMKWEKTITTKREYEESLARLTKIFEADPDSAGGMEAELLVTLIEKYEKEGATTTDAVNQTRQTEVQDMAKRISEYQENAQKELGTKESDLMKPLIEKIKAAIQKVGKAKGFKYVLNSTDGTLLLADGTDITADVKKDLGF